MSETANESAETSAETPIRRRVLRGVLVALAVVIGLPALALGGVLAYWSLRPNTAHVVAELDIDSWPAVADGEHNSNTDLIHWRGHYYLIHASSPWHFASEDCHLVLWRSVDARNWAEMCEFSLPKEDIRDPKFAPIGDRLFLYVLKNRDLNPEPYTTAVASSDDGVQWTDFEDVEPEGWLFWRPKTRDGKTWYVPAYWWEHGKSILLSGTDGTTWRQVSVLHEGDRNDETDIEFLPDGRMIATARLEVSDDLFGDPNGCTLLAVAEPPYTTWSKKRSAVTRLDGPCLFAHDGVVFAVGRHHPGSPGPLNGFGSILGKKRTSLYEVRPDRLIRLSDLPSCGDTSYAGVVVRSGQVLIGYYTNDVDTDPPWILGMVSPSEIRLARVALDRLHALRRRHADD